MKRRVTDDLRGTFRPEFLNRIDEVIVFHALTDAELVAIVDLLLAELQQRIAANDLVLEVTPAARALIVREGTDPAFGARPLKRTIQRLVENPFARALLSGTFRPGDTVVADADPVSGALVFSTESSTVVTDAADRRDARTGPAGEREAAGAGVDARRSAFDLPPLDEPKDPDGGEPGQLGFGDDQSASPHLMRFEEAVRRLEPLPDVLPDGPEALIPVFAETGAPRPRPSWGAADASARPAAVLVLLFPDEDGEARLVLTERADGGGHHSGEVSFPGGRAEPDDADIVATALREAAEEVGLDPVAAGIRVLGTLSVQWIPVSNFTVTPVVAVAERRPSLVAQPSEVAAILEVPLAAFLPDGELRWVEREIRGWDLRYAAYPVEGLDVWGMTARVLGGLGAWLAREEGR